MNGHLRLLHSLVPVVADLKVTIPENHPSVRNLGSERNGSGTLISSDGYILTVHYVTTGAQSIAVTLSDGDQYPGELVGQDQETGLALVKIDARDLPFLAPSQEEPALGQGVVIVSSTGEAERRVSGGYITSFESFDGQWEYMLEKTIRVTAFNPGFGGGALADLKGRLLGVVSLNLNEIGKFSLAIPIEYYLKIADELKTYGRVQSRPPRPWLGVYTQPLAGHIVVAGLVPGGPAEKCGLREGDIILAVGDKEIRSRAELYRELWTRRPGERISMRVLREEEALNLEVVGANRRDYNR
ncbi:MAG TPA: trypsin-like peptidase domain-containing protein [Candidatus Acidoferrales bacterium]|nr:trypsin-like peptidase domain-containing protein [Candidatus Acidoferrales bacterium]